jgi:hypothetical protein
MLPGALPWPCASPVRGEGLDLCAVPCGVDDSAVSERPREVDVNRAVDLLVAMLDLAANEDEHLYPSVVLLDEHVTDVLTWPEDHPELKASWFTLAVSEAGAQAPNVNELR